MIKRFRVFIFHLLFLLLPWPALGNIIYEMNGHSFHFSELAGKWVFINYWATWCQYCLDEIPEFNRFYESQKNHQLQVFAVNYDALPIDEQKTLIKQFDIHYPSLSVDPAAALQLGDVRGLPITYVFNPQGKLSTVLYGKQSYLRLTQLLKQLKST